MRNLKLVSKKLHTYSVFILISIHLILLLKLRFTAWPEVFSFPFLFNNGFRLYSDFVHPYPPLLTVLLSLLYKISGYQIIALKSFTYVLIALSDYFIFKIALNSYKQLKIAVLSVISYIIFQSLLEGNMLWFDTALTLPLILAYYFYINKRGKEMSLALVIALLIKQTALIYIVL